MKFFKPKFWDKKQISFYSIILFPLSLITQTINFLKSIVINSNNFSIPIICIGNIYLGGTGKTPFCVELHNILQKLGRSPVFIRKKHKSYIDEKRLLEKVGQVYEESNRSEALKDAIKNNFKTAIMDDGFQDFTVKKDFSIICFNEKQWIGNGLTIPSGPLRNSLSTLKNVECVIINGKKNKDIENKIFSKNEKIKIFYSRYKPQNIGEFQNKKIIAFAGIGNPENFFNLLIDNKLNVIETIKFPDHHRYSKKELENLLDKIKDNNSILLTTEKDYFRISENYKKNIKCLKIKVEIENKNQFIEEIKKII